MNRTASIIAAASLLAIAGCHSKPTDAGTQSGAPSGPAVHSGKESAPRGHESTAQTRAAAEAYANSEEARKTLAAPPPSVPGLPTESVGQANELAVCRLAFAVKHGEAPRAPSDVEIRSAAFDLATNVNALKECKSRE